MHGGYTLARPANRITLFEIVDAVKGGLKNQPVDLSGLSSGATKAIQRAFNAVDASILRQFSAITLADLKAAKAS